MSTPIVSRPGVSWVNSDRLWRVLMALTPGLVYVAGRLAGLWTLSWLADRRSKDFLDALASWDGRHFVAIAADGYTWSNNWQAAASPAFFPALPKLMALVSSMLDCSERTAGLLISAAAGLVAAYGLAALAEFVPGLGRGGALIMVAVFSIAPMSVVLSMVYTEALFCAAACWGLVFLLRGNWLAAGTLSAVAGLVRPSGVALAGAVAASAVIAICAGRGGWRTWVGALLAPAGFLGWIGYVGYRLGDVNAWFRLQQAGWHSDFDYGAGSLRYLLRTATYAPSVLDVVTVCLMLGSVVLFVLSIRQRQPFELLLYSGLLLLQVLGSDGVMNSKGRLLIPAFTLLLPLAVGLAGRRRSTAVLTLVLLGVLSCWYSAYALIVYGFAI